VKFSYLLTEQIALYCTGVNYISSCSENKVH